MVPAYVASSMLKNALLARFQMFVGSDCNFYSKMFSFFLGRRPEQHQFIWSDCTNHKRLWLQQYLCFFLEVSLIVWFVQEILMEAKEHAG